MEHRHHRTHMSHITIQLVIHQKSITSQQKPPKTSMIRMTKTKAVQPAPCHRREISWDLTSKHGKIMGSPQHNMQLHLAEL